MTMVDISALLLEQLPDSVFVTGVDGVVHYWNAAAETLFGYSSSVALEQSIAALIVPEDRVGEALVRQREADDGGVSVFESVRRRSDGSLAHVSISIRAIRADTGEVVSYLYSLKDVTHLKTRRDAKLVEAKYRDLLESTPDAIMIVNITGRIILANSQAERIFGHTRHEMVGQPVEMLLPMRHRSAHLGHRGGFFVQPRTRSMGSSQELFGLRKNGEEFPVEISLSPLETEEGMMVMSAVRDISDRQADRRRADQKFRALLESAPDAMVIVDPAGKIVLANSQAVNLFGWSRDELLGQPIEVLVPQRFHDVHPGHRHGFFSNPKVRSMGAGLQLFGVRKDGTEVPVEISLSPLETEQGLFISSAIRDVTERRRVEETLQRAVREKEALLKEIHHRVKNNMQVISSLLQLQSNYLDSAETQAVFEESQNRIKSMALIHEKLYQSQDFGHVDFGDYAHSLISMLTDSHAQRSRRVNVRVNATPMPIDIDRAIPAGLILNELVSNCFKHAFPGEQKGSITVETAPLEGERALMRVSDDGVGPGDSFDPSTGRSLGLRLVHILADQLGAELSFSRGPGLSVELAFNRLARPSKGTKHANSANPGR